MSEKMPSWQSTAPRKNGWAPGNYMCRCHVCKAIFIGDKRAITCHVCAYTEADTKLAAAEKLKKIRDRKK